MKNSPLAGKHSAHVEVQDDGSVVLAVEWGAPMAGRGTDHFTLLDDTTLAVTSTVTLADQPLDSSVCYRVVYKRK